MNAVGEIFAGFFATSWSEEHPDTHPDPDSYEQRGCSAHSMVILATNRIRGAAHTPGGLAICLAGCSSKVVSYVAPVSYTHLRAHETGRNLVCRLLLEKKKK